MVFVNLLIPEVGDSFKSNVVAHGRMLSNANNQPPEEFFSVLHFFCLVSLQILFVIFSPPTCSILNSKLNLFSFQNVISLLRIGFHRSKCWLVLLAGPLFGIISRTIFTKEWRYLGSNTRRENYRPRKMIYDDGNFQIRELHLSTRLFQVTKFKIFKIFISYQDFGVALLSQQILIYFGI